MKKQVLTAAVAAVMGVSVSMPATAALEDAGEALLLWSGQIPGSLLGNGIALGSPTGGDIPAGVLTLASDGSFSSSTVQVRAFKTKDDGNGGEELDPDAWFDQEVTWSVQNASAELQVTEGAGAVYDISNLDITMNGTPVVVGDTVLTAPELPDLDITVGYDEAPTGEVFPDDIVNVRLALFAEPPAGAPLP